jgi:ribosomal protein L37E
MAKKPLVHCRRCGLEIDRDNQNDWMMAGKGWYYHISCYEDFVKKKGAITEGDINMEVEDDIWKSAVYDYLRKDLKMSVNYVKFNSQWNNFLKKNMTAKGIYFCLRYFYEIAHGDPKKSENGIGIVPHIYDEGTSYWGERNQRNKGICARIEAQIKQMEEQKKNVVVVHRKRQPKKNKREIDLSTLADMEDYE